MTKYTKGATIMEDFGTMFGSLSTYIRAELIILIPVLHFIINLLKNSGVKHDRVQLYTNCISIVLSAIYVFSTLESFRVQCILLSVYSSMTQGILLAGCAQFSTFLTGTHNTNTGGATNGEAEAHTPAATPANTPSKDEAEQEQKKQ